MIRVQHFATYSGLPSALAIVTGPSRSADIEKRLVFGVHGPRDQLRGLGPPPLPAPGAPADRVHRLRPAHRVVARRDRRRARQAPSPPGTHPPRLVPPLGDVDVAIDERIAKLERLRLGLTECIGCGCLSLDRCQLANFGDRAARLGPGPRY